jgi:hypothetical protein
MLPFVKKHLILLTLLTLATAAVGALSGASTDKGNGKIGPHLQANLPPLEMPTYDPKLLPRPPEVIKALYRFAAEHPEVLSYMPCFCSCDKQGHKSNEDCFVKSRAKNGDVTAFEEHGISCAMCLAVAERAKRLSEAGTPLAEIRADVERRYAPQGVSRTPTPLPPKK